jgi:hypothetical protein
MTIQSLCSSHVCTLVTLTTTAGAAGGRVVAPTKYYQNPCRISELRADRVADFAKVGMDVDYQVFFYYNPRTKTAGQKVRRIEFQDENGDKRVLEVVGEANAEQMDRYWEFSCKETTAVENR